MASNILGQNPADITGALFKSKNLADLPDKVAARTNLNVPSKDDVLYNSVPIGMILPYWGTTAPAGYIPCSGQTVTSTSFPDLVTFLGGTTSAVVPDLRGEFLRGWDNGRGLDTGRGISTVQTDAFQNITGSITAGASTSLGNVTTGVYSGTTAQVFSPTVNPVSQITTLTFDASRVARTSTETRPHNVAVLYCIKAYSSVSNYTSSFNVAGLVSDFSTLNSAAVKYADFIGTNQVKASIGYQKLPGGIIMQWGVASNTGTSTALTFPISFTSMNYSFTSTAFSGNLASRGPLVSISTSTTATGVTWGAETAGATVTTSGTVAMAWIAIGS